MKAILKQNVPIDYFTRRAVWVKNQFSFWVKHGYNDFQEAILYYALIHRMIIIMNNLQYLMCFVAHHHTWSQWLNQ